MAEDRLSATPASEIGKDLPLEALRGLAAIAVVLWHSMLGFFPQRSGIFPGFPQDLAWRGQVWFGLTYGTAAVTLFFVLSGYVLTRRFLLTGDPQIILRGALKRWPRLAGPVLVTTLGSWLLFQVSAYRYIEGGAVTGSPWLTHFAYASEQPIHPHVFVALSQGLFLTFFRGDATYDSSLWTMRFEFIGSFVAFGLAMLLVLPPRERWGVRAALIAVVALLCAYASPFYLAFPAGVALGAFLPSKSATLAGWMVAALIVSALYFFGYTGVGVGAFRPVRAVIGASDPTLLHVVGSVGLIAALECAPPAWRRPLGGWFARQLGAVSFPLYLVHVPVLCSLGCGTLLWLTPRTSLTIAGFAAVAATLVGSFVAAIPLMMFNEGWVGLVNRWTARLLRPASSSRVLEKVS